MTKKRCLDDAKNRGRTKQTSKDNQRAVQHISVFFRGFYLMLWRMNCKHEMHETHEMNTKEKSKALKCETQLFHCIQPKQIVSMTSTSAARWRFSQNYFHFFSPYHLFFSHCFLVWRISTKFSPKNQTNHGAKNPYFPTISKAVFSRFFMIFLIFSRILF